MGETGVAISLEVWQNSEEIWYQDAGLYPSLYVSDIPIDHNAEKIRELHRSLGLNPDIIAGLKFLPLTRASVGSSGTLSTGSVILRYCNDKAAEAALARLKGHPIRLSSGERK